MLRLIDNQVAFQPIREAQVSQGGMIIPESAQGRIKQGIVKAIGPNVKDLKIGDYCVFSGYSGTVFRYLNPSNKSDVSIILREPFVECILHPTNVKVTLDGKDYDFDDLIAHLALSVQSSEWNKSLRLKEIKNG